MLKSYEAIYENGEVKWLAERPPINSARIIVTVLEESSANLELFSVERRHLLLQARGKHWATL